MQKVIHQQKIRQTVQHAHKNKAVQKEKEEKERICSPLNPGWVAWNLSDKQPEDTEFIV